MIEEIAEQNRCMLAEISKIQRNILKLEAKDFTDDYPQGKLIFAYRWGRTWNGLEAQAYSSYIYYLGLDKVDIVVPVAIDKEHTYSYRLVKQNNTVYISVKEQDGPKEQCCVIDLAAKQAIKIEQPVDFGDSEWHDLKISL